MSDATLLLSHVVENTSYGKSFSDGSGESRWALEQLTMIRPRCSVYHALNSGFDGSEASCPTDSFSDTDDDQGNSLVSADSLEDLSCSSKMALVADPPCTVANRHAKTKPVHMTIGSATPGDGSMFSFRHSPGGDWSASERSTTPASSSSSSSASSGVGKSVTYVKIPKYAPSPGYALTSPNSRTEVDFGRLSLHSKSRTLPTRSGSSDALNHVDILSVSSDVIAEQLTLMDFHLYKSIREEELLSCGWADQKYKHTKAPNIMNFIDRFNQTAYWVTVEILERDSPDLRAKIISHFLKVCRQLKALQNLNSEAAVISALRNAAIFRLSKTWAGVSTKEKATLTKRSEFLLEKEKFRTFLQDADPPCIPFLGPFLTELITVKEAYRDSSLNGSAKNGETNAQSRKRKMEEVLQGVLRFQNSEYDRLKAVPAVQKYINSRKYIDALFKFTEDEQYKRSLALEPQVLGDSPSRSKSRSSDAASAVENMIGSPTRPLVIPHGPGSCPQYRSSVVPSSLQPSHSPVTKTLHGNSRPNSARMTSGKFPFTHRKALSLGTNIFRESGGSSGSQSCTPKPMVPKFSLLDDTVPVAAEVIAEGIEGAESPEPTSGTPTPDCVLEADCGGDEIGFDRPETPSSSVTLDRKTASLASRRVANPSSSGNSCCSGSHGLWFGSVVQRKTLHKNHQRVRWTTLKDFWMELRGCRLFLYYHRLMGNRYRRIGYGTEPWKVMSVVGTKVLATSPNSFILSNPESGSDWYFCVQKPETAQEWILQLRRAAIPCDIPENLMEFT